MVNPGVFFAAGAASAFCSLCFGSFHSAFCRGISLSNRGYQHSVSCVIRCYFFTYLGCDALEKEMDICLGVLNIDKIHARSILLGGGTPTDLTPAQLKRFLKYFTKRVNLD